MTKFYETKGNTLYINSDPFNFVNEFTKDCLWLLNNAENSVDIYIDNSVGFMGSFYIGVIISITVLAKQMRKKISIYCSESMKRWFLVVCDEEMIEFHSMAK